MCETRHFGLWEESTEGKVCVLCLSLARIIHKGEISSTLIFFKACRVRFDGFTRAGRIPDISAWFISSSEPCSYAALGTGELVSLAAFDGE